MIISMHIPKTAGHTFNSFLEKIYKDKIYYHYNDVKCEDSSVEVIHGHFTANTYDIKGAKYITWVRHPVYRYLSIFGHYVDKFKYDYKYTVKSLYRFMDEMDFDNSMSAYFCGKKDKFDFIGVVDSYYSSMEKLSKALGIPLHRVESRNINLNKEYRRFVLDNINKVFDKVKKRNIIDFELYESIRRG